MAVKYTDAEIAMLIKEHKPLPINWQKQMCLLDKRGHKQRNLDLSGDKFRLILRQSMINPLDF